MRIAPRLNLISPIRSATNTVRKSRSIFRLLIIVGLVSTAAITLGSPATSANVFGPLFARAVSVFSGKRPAVETKIAPANRTWAAAVEAPLSPSATMIADRRGHTATRLSDGRVLIAGGENASGTLNESEIYDPVAADFSAGGNLNAARADHTATLLGDGRVLIAGGRNGAGALSTTEIFDPASGTFSSGPNLSVARAGHSATLLADGRILFAGGDGSGSAEVIDAGLSNSTPAGPLNTLRSFHSAALLQDGSVLIAGGRDPGGNSLSSGEVFNGSGFSAVSGALTVARVQPLLRVLFDGKVQIIGGSNDGSMEIYDPQIQTFGAYAHVAPEGDTCVGLPAQIQSSQTRAALFHHGQSDAIFDRSSHTTNELGSQAIVIGGVNSSGVVLGTTPTFASTTAAISTDKLDYVPGETVHITGHGFQSGETVRLKIHEDPHTPQERGMDVVTDGQGSFVADYLVQDYDLDMKFLVGARGLTSGLTAQTTFTDANNFTVTPISQTVTAGTTNTFIWTLTATNNANDTTTTFTIPATWTSPQTGAGPGQITVTGCTSGFTILGNVITINQSGPGGRCASGQTLTITYANATAPTPVSSTTYTFAIDDASPDPTVTVNPAVPTSLTVAPAVGTYGGTVALSATLVRTSAPVGPLNGQTISFSLNGNAVGTAVTNASGVASLPSASLAGIAASTYPTGVSATFSGGSGFAASSDTDSLTVNQKSVTASVTASNKTYDGNANATITNCSLTGVLAADTANVTCSAAGPNPFANANVGNGKTVTATNISLSGSASGNYTLSSTSATTTANITTKAITATLTANDKIYDGNATEPDANMSCSLSGVLAADTLNVACAATGGTFNSQNVATANLVTATVTISGSASGNYTLGLAGTTTSSTSATATAQITTKTLTASIVGNPTKTYNGNTNATLTPANFSLTGLIGSESFTVTKTTGSYNSADVATATTVTTSLAPGDFTAAVGTLASNYGLPTTASGAGQINKGTADCSSITGYTGFYDAAAHGATGTCTGFDAGGAATGSTLNLGASFTNVPGGTANWTFTGGTNYTDQSGSVNIVINKATADCSSITGYTGFYDAVAHGASGACTGVDAAGAATGSSLNLGATFTNVPGGTANWTFTGGTNYTDQSGSVNIVINKATANCTSITGYTGFYDAAAHGASGACTGVDAAGAAAGSSLNLGASFTNVPGGTANWTFTGGTNYTDQSGSVNIVINKATANCTSITGYTGFYDATAHGASGTCTGVDAGGAATGSSLNLGATFTNVPGGTANWTFTGGTNYTDQSGSVNIVINKATANCTSITGYTGFYDATAHGASGTCTGVDAGGAATGSSLNLGATFTNVPGGTANWTFTGGTNYTDQSGSVNIVINKATADCSSITGYTGFYDAAAHGATGTCSGVDAAGAAAGSSLNLGASFTNVPGGTANWTFTGGTNYTDQSGSVNIVINKATANCSSITGYTGFYDAAAHGASGACTGVDAAGAAAGSSLNLGASFTNVPGGTANWAFTGGTNYTDQSGSVNIVINKATADCSSITGYTGFYDAAAHGASGTCTGVDGGGAAIGSTLNLGATFTNVPGGTANWTLTGGTNYTDQAGSAAIVINKATANCTSITGYTGFYDAAAHGASGTCTGVDTAGAAIGSSLNLGASFTNVPGGTANWTFTGGTNYTDQSGSVAIVINKAIADCTSITGYTGFYDAAAHGASGTCTGVDSGGAASGSSLNLGASFTNVPGGTANWTFTGGTNYTDQAGSAAIVINKATANCTSITGYTGFYDAAAHGASGTCTGVDAAGAAAGSSLNLGASFTNVPGGTANWTFTGGTNYTDQSGSVNIVINKATANCTSITGYTGFYDAAAHGASGTCTGVDAAGAAAGSSLNLGATFTNVPGGTANWTFTGGTNYTDQSGSVNIVINKATANCTSITGYTGFYDAGTHGASGACTGVDAAGAAAGSSLNLGATFTNVPGGTANWTFTGGTNYTDQSGSVSIVINKLALTVTAVADTKPYDGNISSIGVPTFGPPLAGTDTPGFTQTFDNRNAGTGKTLTPAGVVNDGNGGNNYSYTYNPVTTGQIIKQAITVTAVANTKPYDGNTSSSGVPTFAPALIAPDSPGFTQTFDTRNAGSGKTLTPVGLVNDGNGGNNYSYTYNSVNTGSITQRAVTVTAVANTKPYDGNTSSSGVPTFAPVLIAPDSPGFTQTFDNRNAGTGKTLTPAGLVNDGNGGNNYSYTYSPVSTGQISRRAITVTAVTTTKIYDGNTSSSGVPTISPSLISPDSPNFTQTYDTQFVGTGKTLTPAGSVNDGNGGNNYTVTFAPVTTGVITTAFCFNGFLSPIGGSVETLNGGSFGDPVRSFKLGSTIPIKFSITLWNGTSCGAPVTTGIHTLQAIKYSNATDADPPIDATPTDAATTGNQFRLTDSQWHFNLNTKALSQGTWLLQATLQDGSIHTVWVSSKK